MAQQPLRRHLLTGNCLGQLRKVASQGQRIQVHSQSSKQLQRGSFVGIVPLAFLVECPLRPHQMLGGSCKLAAFPAGAPGNYGDLPVVRRQKRQNLIALFRLRLPEDDAPCDDVGRGCHGVPPPSGLCYVEGGSAAPLTGLPPQPGGKAHRPSAPRSHKTSPKAKFPIRRPPLDLVCGFCRI